MANSWKRPVLKIGLAAARRLLGFSILVLSIIFQDALGQSTEAASKTEQIDAASYETLLKSKSLTEQRDALNAIQKNPEKYASEIQNSLRNYPRLLKTDPLAAKRAVYVSALVRDPSFADILAKHLGNPVVEDECLYDCPIIFALAIQAKFGNWKLPEKLDSELTTVEDLKATIKRLTHITLKVGSIEELVQGPWVESHKKEIEGKTEEQLIVLAGPGTASTDTRLLAIDRLSTLVARSRNRLDFYLLALNDFNDASSEYRSALYETIYRAEVAKAKGL
jgi:hypothetical protein